MNGTEEIGKKKVGRPRKIALFNNSDEYVEKIEEYLKENDEAFKTRPPSLSRFADWLGVSRSAVYGYSGKWIAADEKIKKMFADIIIEHTVVGDYRDAPGIFMLKNVSNWTDKKESVSTQRTEQVATAEEARKNLHKIFKSIGADDRNRFTKKGKEQMAEIEARIEELAEAKVG